ncbi:MAG: PD-(D/E)XK nuclease family protein [Planctomycetota bacterium]
MRESFELNGRSRWIAAICEESRLDEKWLLANSLQSANQWKESVARSGKALLNVHSRTMRAMVMDLAEPLLDDAGLEILTGTTAQFVIQRIVVEAAESERLSYFQSVRSHQRLGEIMAGSIRDIRLAGLASDELDPAKFEVADKADDLKLVLGEYLEELGRLKRVDYAGCCQLILDAVASDKFEFPNVKLLIPEPLRLSRLEQSVLESFCHERGALVFEHDADTSVADAKSGVIFPEQPQSYAEAVERLPKSTREGRTVAFSYAAGEVNEVAAAMRSIISRKVAMDDVEILHTDYMTYVPMIHEFLAGCPEIENGTIESLPVTFGEGMSTIFTRPGRALRSWVRWLRHRHQQTLMVRMLREGLLKLSDGSEGLGFGRLAGVFREVPIGFELERYERILKDEIQRAKLRHEAQRAEEGSGANDGARNEGDQAPATKSDQDKLASQLTLFDKHSDAEPSPEPTSDSRTADAKDGEPAEGWRVAELKAIYAMVRPLVRLTQSIGEEQQAILDAAIGFLKKHARATSPLDEIALSRLVEEIEAEQEALSFSPELPFDTWGWLEDLPLRCRVLTSGPRPGKMHVDHVRRGGHSGRKHTFVVGLDDSRYPSRGGQDPLLLDPERRALSSSLPTKAEANDDSIRELYSRLAGLGGEITISYSQTALGSDAPQFASPILMEVYRHESGHATADEQQMLQQLGKCETFSTWDSDRFITESNWWYSQMLASDDSEEKQRLLENRFAHLQAAREAREHIESDKLTPFDGLVPEAAESVDPTLSENRTSATRMEALGTCPRKFFFRSALRLKPPEVVELDTSRWLDPLSKGLLMHSVFETFLAELTKEEAVPNFERDRDRLQSLLTRRIKEFVDRCPVPNANAFQSQSDELVSMCDIFLRQEQSYCEQTDSVPWIFEPAIGLKSDRDESTRLDCDNAVPVRLADGRELYLGGLIDRIDRLGGTDSTLLSVWDYKSGSTWGFDKADPFKQGRKLQAFLYVGMLRHRARQVLGDDYEVSQFGYFFPSPRTNGQRIYWAATDLAAGDQVVQWLCDIVKDGVFVATNDKEDCKFCDFLAICGNPERTAESTGRMLGNMANTELQPLRFLRQGMG